MNFPPRHHLTAFPLATSLTKTTTPRRHHLTAFPPATPLFKTSPSTDLPAFLSAVYLVSSTSPNRFPAPRKPPWSLALHQVWFLGHPPRLSVVHLERLGFDLFSCLPRPDIFSDPAPLRRCSWNPPYPCVLRVWPSASGYRHVKTTIFPTPLIYSWLQAGAPTTCYTQHFVALNRDLNKYPPTGSPLIIADHRLKATSSAHPALQASRRLPEPILDVVDGLHLRSCVERDTCTDWARDQRAEPLCSVPLVHLPGFTFTTTGRPLQLYPLHSSATSGEFPNPRHKNQRQYHFHRLQTTHGLNARWLHSSTPAPCPTTPRLRLNVVAPIHTTPPPLSNRVCLGHLACSGVSTG